MKLIISLFSIACITHLSEGTSMGNVTNVVTSIPTNIPTSSPIPANVSVLKTTPIATTWAEAFRLEFDKQSTVIIQANFGPLSTTRWIYAVDAGNNLYTRSTVVFQQAMRDIIVNSFRESIVHIPGVFDSKDWFETFLIGSIAGTSEHLVNPKGITPVEEQLSWWDEMRAKNDISYGFRPFDGSPYLYTSARFGRWSDSSPIGIALVRVHYDPILLKSTIDQQLSIFLPLDSALVFGSSYELSNLHNNTHGLILSATLSHHISNWHDGIVFLGVSKNDQTNDTRARFGFNWSL